MFIIERDIHYPGVNLVSRERLDPFIYYFLQIFGWETQQLLYVAAELFILFIGSYLFFSYLRASKLSCLINSFATCAAIIFVVGADPFLLKIHWFPWLLLTTLDSLQNRSRVALLPCLIVITIWCISAGNLAPVGLAVSTIVALLYSAKLYENVTDEDNANREITLSLVLIATLLSIVTLPVYSMPDYPANARLVADPINNQTLIGPYLTPSPVVPEAVEALGEFYAERIALLICCVLLTLVYRIAASRNLRFSNLIKRNELIAIFILLGSLFSLLPEIVLSDKNPYVLTTQIVPGLALAQPWFLLAIAVFLCIILLVLNAKESSFLSFFICLAFCFCFLAKHTIPIPHHFLEFPFTKAESTNLSLAWSPSAHVLATFGPKVTEIGERSFSDLTKIPNSTNSSWKISASVNNEMAKLAIDQNAETRWSTKRPQKSGDVVDLSLGEEMELVRVVLSTKISKADYPRGLVVMGGPGATQLTELLRYDTWPGAIAWTERGYPYFSSKSDVILDFVEPQKISHLQFIQMNNSSTFNWSIDEIKLYEKQRGSN